MTPQWYTILVISKALVQPPSRFARWGQYYPMFLEIGIKITLINILDSPISLPVSSPICLFVKIENTMRNLRLILCQVKVLGII